MKDQVKQRSRRAKKLISAAIAMGLLLFLALPAIAEVTPESIAKKVKEREASGLDRVSALMMEIVNTGDFRFDATEIQTFTKLIDCSESSIDGILLLELKSISKKGNKIILRRKKKVSATLEFGGKKSFLFLDKKGEFRIRKDGRKIRIDEIGGLKVAEKRNGSRYNVRYMLLRKGRRGERLLDINAGVFLFNRTETMNLTELAEEERRNRLTNSGSSDRGISDAIEGTTDD
jgi:hypothetical protein